MCTELRSVTTICYVYPMTTTCCSMVSIRIMKAMNVVTAGVKDYGYKPTESELKEDIVEHINKLTDAKILKGFTYEGSLVYLSAENQFNYKVALTCVCLQMEATYL